MIQDYIKVFENTVPLDLCDALLNEFSGSGEWVDTVVDNDVVNKNIRSASAIFLSKEIINKNTEIRAQLDAMLFRAAGSALQKYLEIYPKAQIRGDTGYQLLRYETGQFYAQHTDSYEKHARCISCSFALNDGYEGGEFAFFDRNTTIRLPKGAAILFPSNFMFPHEILPVLSGTRYSMVTWFV
jgi:predicted 2-oxoglutarate/Fe(II)-dependent dioxygenase YbiX